MQRGHGFVWGCNGAMGLGRGAKGQQLLGECKGIMVWGGGKGNGSGGASTALRGRCKGAIVL